MNGAVVSCTVTVKLPLDVLPFESDAEQFTVMVATGNMLPDGGTQVTATTPSTMSVAEAEKMTTAPNGPVASSVIFAGRVSVGGVVSCTVTMKLPFAVLPAKSDAEQLTVVVAIGNVLPDVGEQVTGREPSTISAAEAENVATAPEGPVASSVMFDGRVSVGGVVSCTVTVKLPLAVLPLESDAEQLTVVVAIGNVLPDEGAQVTVTVPSTISAAEAENVATAPEGPVASNVMFDGRVNVGAVVSCTVTVKLPFAVLPRVSDAEQLTVVLVIGNVLPDAGVQVTGRGPSTMSVAVAENVATAPDELVASSVMFDGRVSAGGVVSCTVTVKLPFAVLPRVSDAEQLTVVVATGNVLPEAGVHVTVRAPSTLSFAVAEKVTTAPAGLVASVVMFAGKDNTGGTASFVQPNVFPEQDVIGEVTLKLPLKTLTPYAELLLNVPPLMLTIVDPVPFTFTPEPKMSVPFPFAVTLFKFTTFALFISMPLKSLLLAITFVRVTVGALKVAPL